MSNLYPTSQWTQVRQIQAATPDERAALIGRFIERYLPAIRADVERYMSRSQAHDIDDAVQEFVADKIYEGFVIDQADSKRGRLSRYLQACVHHFVYSKDSPRVRAVKPIPIGDEIRELEECLLCTDSHQNQLDLDWVAMALKTAIQRTKEELIRKNKQIVWHVLESRLLCESTNVEPFKVIANRLGLTQKESANLLITGKRALKRNIFTVFSERVPNSKDIEADIFEACDHIFRERLSFGVQS